MQGHYSVDVVQLEDDLQITYIALDHTEPEYLDLSSSMDLYAFIYLFHIEEGAALEALYESMLSGAAGYINEDTFRRRLPTLGMAIKGYRTTMVTPLHDMSKVKDQTLLGYVESDDPRKWQVASRILFFRREYRKCALFLSKINDLTSLKLLGETYDIRPGRHWKPTKIVQRLQSDTIHTEQVQCMLVMKRMGVAKEVALIMCKYISDQNQ